MKYAAVQMTSGLDVAANVATARRLVREAAAEGAKLAVLPENFALMALKERDKRAIGETDGDGPVQNQLSECARESGVTLVAGTFPIRVPGEERGLRRLPHRHRHSHRVQGSSLLDFPSSAGSVRLRMENR